MSRDAVHANAPPNKLIFPLNFRPLVGGWNLLYLHPGPLTGNAGAGEAQDGRQPRQGPLSC